MRTEEDPVASPSLNLLHKEVLLVHTQKPWKCFSSHDITTGDIPANVWHIADAQRFLLYHDLLTLVGRYDVFEYVTRYEPD